MDSLELVAKREIENLEKDNDGKGLQAVAVPNGRIFGDVNVVLFAPAFLDYLAEVGNSPNALSTFKRILEEPLGNRPDAVRTRAYGILLGAMQNHPHTPPIQSFMESVVVNGNPFVFYAAETETMVNLVVTKAVDYRGMPHINPRLKINSKK